MLRIAPQHEGIGMMAQRNILIVRNGPQDRVSKDARPFPSRDIGFNPR